MTMMMVVVSVFLCYCYFIIHMLYHNDFYTILIRFIVFLSTCFEIRSNIS